MAPVKLRLSGMGCHCRMLLLPCWLGIAFIDCKNRHDKQVVDQTQKPKTVCPYIVVTCQSHDRPALKPTLFLTSIVTMNYMLFYCILYGFGP